MGKNDSACAADVPGAYAELLGLTPSLNGASLLTNGALVVNAKPKLGLPASAGSAPTTDARTSGAPAVDADPKLAGSSASNALAPAIDLDIPAIVKRKLQNHGAVRVDLFNSTSIAPDACRAVLQQRFVAFYEFHEAAFKG